jgi:hypothetical protein
MMAHLCGMEAVSHIIDTHAHIYLDEFKSDLSSMLDRARDAGVERIAVPYLPAGWTRDALWPDLAPLAAEGRVTTLLGDLDRATWPHAKAGFFGVAKALDGLLAECGIGAGA